jgi:ribosomal protein S27E
MPLNHEPKCCKCNSHDWLPIPDSIDIACKNCGAVLVLGDGPDGYVEGVSLLKRAEDLAND